MSLREDARKDSNWFLHIWIATFLGLEFLICFRNLKMLFCYVLAYSGAVGNAYVLNENNLEP